MRNTIDEALKMHQLNFELLEQLDVACKWLLENNIQVSNRGKFVSLLSRADALLKEIDSPLFQDHQTDESLQGNGSDDNFTEPKIVRFIY